MKIHKKMSALLLVLGLILSACAPFWAESGASEESLKVYTSFYPLYYLSQRITGSRAQVEYLVPAGVEPHDFEPSMKQVVGLYGGQVFVFLGEGMEPWAKKLQKDLAQEGVLVLEAGEGLIENEDPHIWLDPLLARDLAYKIYLTLVKADPQNRDHYEENFFALEDDLQELHEEYKGVLTNCPLKDLVISHASLGYLVQRYGLNQVAIAGLSPQEEPSLKKMTELVNLVEELQVPYILTERLGPNKLSETLAKEVGISTLEFNPLETLPPGELSQGYDYFSVMRDNLKVLRKALGG